MERKPPRSEHHAPERSPDAAWIPVAEARHGIRSPGPLGSEHCVPAPRLNVWSAWRPSHPSCFSRNHPRSRSTGRRGGQHRPPAGGMGRLKTREAEASTVRLRDSRRVAEDASSTSGRATRGGLMARWMSALSHHLASQAAAVISPLPEVGLYLAEMGITHTPFSRVPNGVELLPEDQPRSVPQRDHFTFMYLGSHGTADGLPTVLRAFDMASTRRPDLVMKLRLVGDGPKKDELRSFAQSLESASHITLERGIPQSEVQERSREADCLVASVLDKPVYRFGVGLNKFYTYLSAFRPALVATKIPGPVAESGGGITVPSDHVQALADAMIEVATLACPGTNRHGRKGIPLRKLGLRL